MDGDRNRGGWNRRVIEVDDLTSKVFQLRAEGIRVRNDIVSGPGGGSIPLEDPTGNPLE